MLPVLLKHLLKAQIFKKLKLKKKKCKHKHHHSIHQAEENFHEGVTDGSDGKEITCNAGDPGSISGLGRSPGEGNGYTGGNTLQYPCLDNFMEGGIWQAIIHEVSKSQLSD